MKTQVELKITGNSTRSVSLSKGLHFQHKIGSILSAAVEKNRIGMGFQLVNFACNWRYLPIESTFLTKGTKTQMDIWCQDGYQPYLISPEKGSRALIKGVPELLKQPPHLCVEKVHRVFIDIVSTIASATPGLGRWPLIKRLLELLLLCMIFRVEAKQWRFTLLTWNQLLFLLCLQHLIHLLRKRIFIVIHQSSRHGEELPNWRAVEGVW